jgi:hypothetical protein
MKRIFSRLHAYSGESDHGIRLKVITESGRNRSLIPVKPITLS